ncbi:MAG: mechanosensitive ion channel family protein [Acidobacteriota bacterium]
MKCKFARVGFAIPIALAVSTGASFLLSSFTSMAETLDKSVETRSEPHLDIAPVIVDGGDIFTVVGVSANPAEERAAEIAQRIVGVAQKTAGIPQLSLRPSDSGTEIYLDNRYIMTVNQVDVEHEGMDAQTLAKTIGGKVREEIIAYRERRSESGLNESLVTATIWTAVFAAYAIILWLSSYYIIKYANYKILSWIRRVEDKTGRIAKTEAIVSTTRVTFWSGTFLLFVTGFYYYLSQVLYSFPGTRGIAAILLQYFTGPILDVLRTIGEEVPDLFMIAVIYFLVRYFLKIIRLIFENIEVGMIRIENFEPDWTWPTYWILKVILVLFAIVIAYPYIPGSETAAFKGITILLGVILSFGSTSVVSNLLSGLFVIYRRGINVGDWIQINGQMGFVESITLLETQLRSSKNELISIPNTQLLSSELTNYTRQGKTDGILLHSSLGIGYDEPQQKIERMLLEAAGRTHGLKTNPAPFVLRQALEDYSIVYEINAYAESVHSLPKLKSALHSNILNVFNENRVQIMTPSYESDPVTPKIAPAESIE